MYKSKRQKCKRVLKGVFYLFILCFQFLPVVSARAAVYSEAESFLFSFKEGNDMFLADYGDNAYQLERLGQRLPVLHDQLLDGSYHLLIVSHVGAYNYGENTVINEASLRAGRIRSYMKTRLDIPHDCVAFYIDRSGNYRDQVHVYLIKSPLPWFANLEISYCESHYPVAVDEAIRKYGNIPYVDLYPRGEADGTEREVYVINDPLFDRSELEDYRLSITKTEGKEEKRNPEKGKKEIEKEEIKTADTGKKTEPVIATVLKDTPPSSKAYPVKNKILLAVKTNLIPWFGVAPSVMLGSGDTGIQKGAFMPNLEVECYFSERWSVYVSALYADFTYQGNPDNLWGVSSVTAGARVWPCGSGTYKWLNAGLFARYGDFDVRGAKVAPEGLYGRTGRFWSGGASIGCLVPVYGGFCVEGEVQGGYRSVFEGKKYRYDEVDSKNYLESRFSSTGLMVGFKVSLLYRFGIK